jgi:hypothetical protein
MAVVTVNETVIAITTENAIAIAAVTVIEAVAISGIGETIEISTALAVCFPVNEYFGFY